MLTIDFKCCCLTGFFKMILIVDVKVKKFLSQRSQTGKVGEPSGVTDGPCVAAAAAASTTDSTASSLEHTERAAPVDFYSFTLDLLRRN